MKRTGWIIWVVAIFMGITAQAQQRNILLIIGDDIGLDSLLASNRFYRVEVE